MLIFVMGTIFGSFFTLAVYRIPLNKDITHERSFCPNCNHRLEFLDLIPVWSYIFLNGKCRYCGEKIRPRYLLLEILSGIVFVITYLSFKFDFPFFEIDKLIKIAFFVMLYITLVLIAGIDKEYNRIDKRVFLFGLVTASFYILYLFFINELHFIRYMVYLILLSVLFIIDIFLCKKGKSLYCIHILELLIYILLNVEYKLFLIIVAINFFIFAFLKVMKKVKIPMAFYISIISIASIIINNFIIY